MDLNKAFFISVGYEIIIDNKIATLLMTHSMFRAAIVFELYYNGLGANSPDLMSKLCSILTNRYGIYFTELEYNKIEIYENQTEKLSKFMANEMGNRRCMFKREFVIKNLKEFFSCIKINNDNRASLVRFVARHQKCIETILINNIIHMREDVYNVQPDDVIDIFFIREFYE